MPNSISIHPIRKDIPCPGQEMQRGESENSLFIAVLAVYNKLRQENREEKKRVQPIAPIESWGEKFKCQLHTCSVMSFFVTPLTGAYQALSMGFSRQEYWSRLSFPTPGDHPHPGIEPTSLSSPALAGRFFTTVTTWKVK